jgi:hypothetical protein
MTLLGRMDRCARRVVRRSGRLSTRPTSPRSPCRRCDALVGTRPQISGPEALITAEQALALGMPVRSQRSQEEARAQALAAGYPADLVEALLDGTGHFMPQPVTGAVEEITGRPPRSVRRWALDHAEAFR